MRLEPEWALARRIALLVADSPGRGMHRLELLERLGMPWCDVKPSAMLAYKRGGIDFCRDYVIAPARRSRPQPELAAPFTDPFLHPLDTPPQVGYAGSMTHTERELRKLPKHELAAMHKRNGGLMPLATYQKWTKDELVATILEDERLAHTYGERLATEQRIFARWDDES